MNTTSITLPPAKSELIRLLAFDFLHAQKRNLQQLSILFDQEWPIDVQVMHQSLEGLLQGKQYLDLKEAGTPARILLALTSAFAKLETTLLAAPSLSRRPFDELIQVLRSWGAIIHRPDLEDDWYLEVRPSNLTLSSAELDMSKSSQFASALAILASGLRQNLQLNLKGSAVSLPYLHLTLKMLGQHGAKFQLTPTTLLVNNEQFEIKAVAEKCEKDWSSAAFFCIARLLLPVDHDLFLEGLSPNSLHPDRKILEILSEFGLVASSEPNGLRLKRRLVPLPSKLSFQLADSPDLVPALVVYLACHIKNPVYLEGVGHLAFKESNRLGVLDVNLWRFGSRLEEIDKNAILYPISRKLPLDSKIATVSDHRILMAFAPLSLLGVRIEPDNYECVRKSFPFFHREWAKLCPQWPATPSE